MNVTNAQKAAELTTKALINLNLETILFLVFVFVGVFFLAYKWINAYTKRLSGEVPVQKNKCPESVVRDMNECRRQVDTMTVKVEEMSATVKSHSLVCAELTGAIKVLVGTMEPQGKKKK